MAMTFTATELHTIQCALEVAAKEYEKDAAMCAADGLDQVAAHFDLQQRQCRKLLYDLAARDLV